MSLATSARAGAGIRTGGGSRAPAGCQGSSRQRGPVPVGRHHGERIGGEGDLDGAESGQRVVPGRGDHDLPDRGGELGGVGLPGRGGQLGQRRVVIGWQQAQGVPGAAAARVRAGPSLASSAGWRGSCAAIAASRRPGTSTVPGSPTSAAMRARAEVSWSNAATSMPPSGLAVIFRPPRIG